MNMQGDGQDCFSRRRNVKELLHFKDDDSGYIEGRVFMIWPPRNKSHRINLEVVEDSTLYRFEVEVPHKDGIAFRPHEHVSFALKGTRVDRRGESSSPHYFPIVLRFPNGVVLKYLSGTNAGKVVDTWEGKCIHSKTGNRKLMFVLEGTGSTDEWYNPGMVHTVSDAVTIDASETHHGSIPTVTYPPMQTHPRRDATSCHNEGVNVDRPPPPLIAVTDGAATAQSMPPAQQPSTGRLGRSSRVGRRKKRKLHKEKEPTFPDQLANNTDSSRPVDVATPCHEQPQTSIHCSSTIVSDSHPKLHQASGYTNGEASVQEDSGIDLSRENNHSNAMTIPGEASVPALRLKAGIRTQRVRRSWPCCWVLTSHSNC